MTDVGLNAKICMKLLHEKYEYQSTEVESTMKKHWERNFVRRTMTLQATVDEAFP